jgi:NADH-quinone oxidoreductase subunit E
MKPETVDKIIEEYERSDSWLVMILQDIQQEYNYLPQNALEKVAESLDIPLSRVYNVATFYSSLSLAERGRHVIRVCDGTACHLRGFDNLRDELQRQLGITEGQTTEDRLFTLEVVACLGACALAPVMAVDGKCYGNMDAAKVRKVLESYSKKSK